MNTIDPTALAHSDALWAWLLRNGLKQRRACKSFPRVGFRQPCPVAGDSQGIRVAKYNSTVFQGKMAIWISMWNFLCFMCWQIIF